MSNEFVAKILESLYEKSVKSNWIQYPTLLNSSPLPCTVASPEQQTSADELDKPALFTKENRIDNRHIIWTKRAWE